MPLQQLKKSAIHLFNVLDNPSDAQGRLELAQASTMAGIAFSNSMVGLVHSLGHALGAVAHLPHGLCMNLFLPYVLEYNKEVNADKIADLLLPLAGADIYAQTPAHLRADKTISSTLAMRDRLACTDQIATYLAVKPAKLLKHSWTKLPKSP